MRRRMVPVAGILQVAAGHQARDVQIEEAVVDGREDDTAVAERPFRIFPAVSREDVVEIHLGDCHIGAWGVIDE
jgi:hypothetical protein